MRNLVTLIDEMLVEIPSKEKHLIESLKDIQDSQRYRGLEDMLGWTLVSEELQNLNLKPESENWKYKICSIFSTMTVDEIKEHIKLTKKTMTREEEIINSAKEHGKQTFFCDLVKSASSKGVNSAYGLGFIEGAVWADNNPSQKALAKELYRLGYTITLNGDIIPRAEEEKAMKSYIEYQKSQVIEKAVEWLIDNFATSEVDDYNQTTVKTWFVDTDEMIEDFKKAMEGDDK